MIRKILTQWFKTLGFIIVVVLFLLLMIKLSNASQEKELHGYICTHINSIPPVSGVGITEKEAWKDMITKSCESMISEYERYRGPVEPGGAVFNAITDICVNRKCTTMEKF